MPKKNETKTEGAQFVRFFGPLLDALRSLGGSGRPREVTDKIAEMLDISEQEQSDLMESGTPRFPNQVAWARFYLTREGLLDSSQKGVWSLTDQGRAKTLTPEESRELFLKWVRIFSEQKKKNSQAQPSAEVSAPDTVEDAVTGNHRDHLLNILKELPPAGFERLCQRLLREAGFAQVTVTGRSGDGGIDGNGLLQINPFVSFRVLFQCKRYDRSVTPSQVRDFRGAMTGRADKGIILTTGTFTVEAGKEAVRDGAPPIELVDGQKLVDMFEHLQLGLKPVTTYDIDESFFDDFAS